LKDWLEISPQPEVKLRGLFTTGVGKNAHQLKAGEVASKVLIRSVLCFSSELQY
jgi:hypothetical protein